MAAGTMGWWYWFGMQIFGIACLVLTWWLFLDATRRKSPATRFLWPIIALAGLLMQIPAFTVAETNQATGTGTAAAALGVFGLIVVSLAAITHFYKSPSAGGSGWSMRTRDENSSSRSTDDRRRTRAPQASVAVSAQAPARPRSIPPVAPAAATTVPAQVAASTTSGSRTVSTTRDTATDTRYHAPASSRVDTGTMRPAAETVSDEPAVTLADETSEDATLGEPDALRSATATLIEDSAPSPTIIEDSRTILNEPDDSTTVGAESPRLIITDGKTSRIVITEHSGSFIVGRDPSRSSLAVDDPRASRAHFSIIARDDDYLIYDLGSSNGTFVNGALVTGETVLKDGDTIEFGRTVATFRMSA